MGLDTLRKATTAPVDRLWLLRDCVEWDWVARDCAGGKEELREVEERL